MDDLEEVVLIDSTEGDEENDFVVGEALRSIVIPDGNLLLLFSIYIKILYKNYR